MATGDEEFHKEKPPQDSSALSKLKSRLYALRENEDGFLYENEEERIHRTEKAISAYVKSAIEVQNCGKSFVIKKLIELYKKDFLIHKQEILDYGILEVEKYGKVECIEKSPTLPERSIKSQLIFCKENVFHACLCCEAVSKCNHQNVKEFFKDEHRKHRLEEVSMSLSNHYLIAKSQSTFIIAFNGEQSFTSWFDACEKQQCGYKLEKGLESRANEVPLRFLVKQLLVEKNRVIFTGFSSGGLLACMVASVLWKDNSYIGSDELKANTMCLTFGQPIINMPCISELAQKYPDFTATIHQVYLKCDLIPQIFLCAASRQISLVITDKSKIIHYKPFLHYLGELQRYYNDNKALGQSCEELNKLKEVIVANTSEFLIRGDELPFQLFGTQYLISVKNGLTWKQLAPESVLKELGPLKWNDLENVTCESLFKNHNIKEVFNRVFASYLDKSPQFKITEPVTSFSDVATTKPVTKSIAFHQHGNELAITLEGDNLWFVNSIQVGTLNKLSVSAMATNQKSIQFNLQYKPNPELSITADAEVKVIVDSQFCKPIKSSLKVTKKLYEISARQEQLAKHKPSEIIELAFLSALLERQISEKAKESHKMTVIRRFLEEVVKLVPLESLFYALGCGDNDIIEDCCGAIIAFDLPRQKFVPSEMLLNGMGLALQRLTTGRKCHEHEFQRPHSFSDRIGDMLLQTRLLLGYEENETVSSQYYWPAIPPQHPVLYSEVVASQGTSPVEFNKRNQPNPSGRCRSEKRGRKQVPNRPRSLRQTSSPATSSDIFMDRSSSHRQMRPKRSTKSAGAVPEVQNASSGKPPRHSQRKMEPTSRPGDRHLIEPIYLRPLLVYSRCYPNIAQQDSDMSDCKRKVIQYLTDFLPSRTHICQNAISSVPISSVYPASKTPKSSGVVPPIDLLCSTRKELEELAKKAVIEDKEEQGQLEKCNNNAHSSSSKVKSVQKSETTLHNREMLDMITSIRKKQKVYSTLLGAFMQAQVRVPLVKKTVRDTAQAIGKTAIAVGLWALLSMPYFDLRSFLTAKFSSLIVEVARFIHGTYSDSNAVDVGDEYAGKLQFLLQGIETTVSCNSRYISYSLEQQLKEECTRLNIDASTDLKKLIDNWDVIFNNNVLSLVTPQSRELVARWLKWSLMIHNLREELAKYTSIGIVGLVNSGKSKLVSSLFNIPVPAGTRESKRTTIPFIYNIGNDLEGMDVIDFPGVDDRDETIPELAELLLSLAQIVVFVVDYKKAHTKATQEWLDRLAHENVYVLVCLTYGDKLYAELMSKDGKHRNQAIAKSELQKQKELIADKLGESPNRTVYLMTLSQDKDSVLNTDENRKRLLEVGLKCYFDVGDWLVSTLENLHHDELAVKMTAYIQKKKKESKWYIQV